MCGRYSLEKAEADLAHYYKGSVKDLPGYRPNYNAAPTQDMPVATHEGLELMKWGLVPNWSKEFKALFTSINARAESVAEKPMYRTPFKKRRALIPATGFYEWRKSDKQPFYFHLPDRELFSFAGLYDVWFDAHDVPHKSYTIITTTPNGTMDGVHDRMPVILDGDEEQYWIDPAADPEQLKLLLNPYDHEMGRYEVDKAVGSVRNNSIELIKPMA